MKIPGVYNDKSVYNNDYFYYNNLLSKTQMEQLDKRKDIQEIVQCFNQSILGLREIKDVYIKYYDFYNTLAGNCNTRIQKQEIASAFRTKIGMDFRTTPNNFIVWGRNFIFSSLYSMSKQNEMYSQLHINIFKNKTLGIDPFIKNQKLNLIQYSQLFSVLNQLHVKIKRNILNNLTSEINDNLEQINFLSES